MAKNNIQLFFQVARCLQRWFCEKYVFRLSQNYTYPLRSNKNFIPRRDANQNYWNFSSSIRLYVVTLLIYQLPGGSSLAYGSYGVFLDSGSEKSAASGWNYSNPFSWKTGYTMRISVKNCITYSGISQIGKLLFQLLWLVDIHSQKFEEIHFLKVHNSIYSGSIRKLMTFHNCLISGLAKYHEYWFQQKSRRTANKFY